MAREAKRNIASGDWRDATAVRDITDDTSCHVTC